ncbi:hypothetical protein [Sphingomonas sp. KR3-1]|uniref:hypothetical protein n=1 Tax=Sphingomonas sp. KR3-1 TaxID=3156611 RepID=UPI0032B3B3B6
MTQWLVALGVVLLSFAAMPWIVRWAKSAGGKGKMGGIAMGLGLVFAILFDPAKREAIENIEDQKARREEAGQGEKLE